MMYSKRITAFWAVLLMAVLPVSQVMAEGQEGSGAQKVRQNLESKELRERWRQRADAFKRRFRAAAPHWRAFIDMGRRFARVMRLRVRVEGTIGLEDPADTVMFFALLRYLDSLSTRCELALERDYFDATLELDARIDVRVWPPRLALVGLGLLLNRETRRALLAVR